jgi:PAS domain S-box-containing protein
LDISRLKQTEFALRSTHNRVITILESISDGFFSLDRQFRVTFVNETGARAIGQTRESMLGRVLWEIFPEAVGSDFERAYRKAMTERVTATTESSLPAAERMVRGARLSLRGRHQCLFQGCHGPQEGRADPA